MTTIKGQRPDTTEGPEKAGGTDAAGHPDTAGHADTAHKLTLAEILEIFAGGRLPLHFTAYDGSSAGPADAPFGIELKTPRGTTYLATARGDLGLARAYIAGDLDIHGVHPGDPYELLKALADELVFRMPSPRVMAQVFRSVLNLPVVPPDVPFSQLGGTSLDAGRVCARLSDGCSSRTTRDRARRRSCW